MSLGTFRILPIKCKPCISEEKKKSIEEGGRILLPSHLLNEISFENSPTVFKISHEKEDGTFKETNAGVLEFFNEDRDIIYSPTWIMKNIGVTNEDSVEVEEVRLVKGTDITLCPFNDLFFTIHDKVKVLEKALVNFPCLKKGDIIPVTHNKIIHELQITLTLPKDEIMINECDVNVDFEVKPEEPEPCFEEMMPEIHVPFSGSGNTLGGGTVGPQVIKRKEYTRGSLPDYDYVPNFLKFDRPKISE